MGLSRASRIKLLLAIDTVFFFVELIVGEFKLIFYATKAEIKTVLDQVMR